MPNNTHTGRTLIWDNDRECVVDTTPTHTNWERWGEWADDEGDVWWSSDDPESTILSAEEFWGGEEKPQPLDPNVIYRVVFSPVSMTYIVYVPEVPTFRGYNSMKQATLHHGDKPLVILTSDVFQARWDAR